MTNVAMALIFLEQAPSTPPLPFSAFAEACQTWKHVDPETETVTLFGIPGRFLISPSEEAKYNVVPSRSYWLALGPVTIVSLYS